MATLKLIPTSYNVSTGATMGSMENALTDTDSETYGHFKSNSSSVASYCYLYFGTIPSNIIITAVEVKVKARSRVSSQSCFAKQGSSTTFAQGTVVTGVNVITLSLRSEYDIQQLAGASDVNILIYNDETEYLDIYGAEINIEYHVVANKIIYGENTLIDLTSDTVTASDVLSGKTFHLADGNISTGTCSYNCDTSSDTATASDVLSGKTFHLASGVRATGNLNVYKLGTISSFNTTTNKSIVFSSMLGEPQAFVVTTHTSLAYTSSASNKRVVAVVYNGTSTYGFYYVGGTSGGVQYSTNYSFSYSDNRLTISATTSSYGQFYSGERYYLTYVY